MRRPQAFLVLLLAGLLVYSVGGYLAMPRGARWAAKVALPVVLFLVHRWCRRREDLRAWRNATAGLLAASVGFLVAWIVCGPLLAALGVPTGTVAGLAATRFAEALAIGVPAIAVARAAGLGRSELFLVRGRLGLGLALGLGPLAVFAVLFVLQAGEAGIERQQLLAWTPAILVFCFSNAALEELHFRGLLLRPFEELLGRGGSNLCIAAFFTLVHAPVEYTPDVAVFLAVLFPLALAWGWVTRVTGALWSAVLFHAAADLMILPGILETYAAG